MNLIKLSVGSQTYESLRDWQQQRLRVTGELIHPTRNIPRLKDKLVDGGSIYWIIKGKILCRQKLQAIDVRFDEAGRRFGALVLSVDLIPVEPTPHRIFQGWRYFAPDLCPPDTNYPDRSTGTHSRQDPKSPEIARHLKNLGLLE